MNGFEQSVNSQMELKKKAAAAFLNKEKISGEGAKENYSLKNEFERSRKNRHPMLYLAVIAFVAGLSVFVFAAKKYLDVKNNNAAVNIKDFEDVNLTELINLAKKNEEDLNRARQDLEESEKNMKSQLQQTKETFERERRKIQAHEMPKAQKSKLLSELKKKEKESIKAIETNYKKEIDEKQQKIVVVKEKILVQDQKLQDNLKKSEKMFQDAMQKSNSVLAETRKVYEIGLSKQKDFYESRLAALNVRYESDTALLKEEIKKMTAFLASSEKENTGLKEKIELQVKNYEQLNQKHVSLEENYHESERKKSELSKKLASEELRLAEKEAEAVSLQSKLAAALNEKEIQKEEIKKLNQGLENFKSTLAIKNEMIQKFLYTLDLVAKKRKDQGYVLDPSDTKRIVLVINNHYSVKYGDLALVFDENNQYVATLKFMPDSSRFSDLGLFAEAMDLAPGKTIESFYKIIIKFKTEKKK